MMEKRNRFCAFIIGMMVVMLGMASAQAEDAIDTSAPVLAIDRAVDVSSDPVAVTVATQLRAVQARDGTAAFAQMTPELQAHYKNNPKTYMSMLRLQQHELYNHRVFRVLDLSHNGDLAIHKIVLQSRDGAKTLAIFRLRQQTNGSWKIDAVAVVPDTDERGA